VLEEQWFQALGELVWDSKKADIQFEVIKLKNKSDVTNAELCQEIRHSDICLISYESFQHWAPGKDWEKIEFSVAIFDEAHTIKNLRGVTVPLLLSLRAAIRIQLSRTLMHHTISDWVAQV
jgi:SNF2 family DNA or RNA helicase